MLFLELLGIAYLIVAILTFSIIFSVINNKVFRGLFVFLGLLMPVIFLYSAVRSLFSSKPMPRCNQELVGIEDEIEAERVRIFGGEKTAPSFGCRWEAAYNKYLEQLLERAATTSQKIAATTSQKIAHYSAAAAGRI